MLAYRVVTTKELSQWNVLLSTYCTAASPTGPLVDTLISAAMGPYTGPCHIPRIQEGGQGRAEGGGLMWQQEVSGQAAASPCCLR